MAGRARDCSGSSAMQSTIERLPVLARHNGNKMPLRDLPPCELALSACAARIPGVLPQQPSQQVAVVAVGDSCELDHRAVAIPFELAELIEYESPAAAHSSREVPTGRAKYDDGSACHILAAVIAYSFHNRDCTAVPDCKALARNSGDVRF